MIAHELHSRLVAVYCAVGCLAYVLAAWLTAVTTQIDALFGLFSIGPLVLFGAGLCLMATGQRHKGVGLLLGTLAGLVLSLVVR